MIWTISNFMVHGCGSFTHTVIGIVKVREMNTKLEKVHLVTGKITKVVDQRNYSGDFNLAN